MVHTDPSIGSLKKLAAVILCGLLLSSAAVCSGEDLSEATKRSCALSQFLSDPVNRARYEDKVIKARNSLQDRRIDIEAMYGEVTTVSIRSGDGKRIDSFSANCLSCHDGVTAFDVQATYKNNPIRKMPMISGKHPIGMDYGRYAMLNPNLKQPHELSPELVLVNGNVSCITCHDPVGTEKFRLVKNSSGADLCMECHVI
jgi:predicted CXXCH cytochrome family protein